ncbi:MAG: hypothetical protein GY940_32300 [bacterium]|nr:hypothetical protein [bacterium]
MGNGTGKLSILEPEQFRGYSARPEKLRGMHPFMAAELGEDFDLAQSRLNRGKP